MAQHWRNAIAHGVVHEHHTTTALAELCLHLLDAERKILNDKGKTNTVRH